MGPVRRATAASPRSCQVPIIAAMSRLSGSSGYWRSRSGHVVMRRMKSLAESSRPRLANGPSGTWRIWSRAVTIAGRAVLGLSSAVMGRPGTNLKPTAGSSGCGSCHNAVDVALTPWSARCRRAVHSQRARSRLSVR